VADALPAAPRQGGSPIPTTLGASVGQAFPAFRSEAVSSTRSTARRALWIIPLAAALVGGAFWLRSGSEAPPPTAEATVTPPAPDAQSLRPPQLALDAMERYRHPEGSERSQFRSSTWWETVARDFETAAAQEGAPARWTVGATLARGYLTLLDGDPKAAVGAFRAAIAGAPEWAIPHEMLSIGLSRLGDYDAALRAAQDAQRLDPDWAGAIAAGARVLVEAHKLDDAVAEYRRALSRDEGNAALIAELALLYHGMHVDAEAKRYAQRALDLDPELVPVRILLAEDALERKHDEEAVEQASRALASDPKSLSAALIYADSLAALKRRAEARAAYQKVLEIAEERGDVATEHDARLALVRKALARKRLPPPRFAPGKPNKHSHSSMSPPDRSLQQNNGMGNGPDEIPF
jgi:tetratricopeptide (TPR) repeat protein